jgi:peptidyl-prolyl cis-trans isomerase C
MMTPIPDKPDERRRHCGRYRWLHDPLVGFLLLGAAIFAGWWLMQQRGADIRVTPAIRLALAQDYTAMFGRAPTAAQQAELVEAWVAEEILFREALDRGLHLTDPVTRERLVDRVQHMISGPPPIPTEADLVAYHARRSGDYRHEPQITLEHRFFAEAPSDPATMLSRLRAGAAVAADDFPMGQRFDDHSEAMVRGLFGAAVLSAARTVSIGQWHGPYRSARGVHFIRIDARTPARPMAYAQAREQVRLDWLAAAAKAPVEREVARIRGRYHVVDAP